jgi:hypothetical protein
VTALQAAQDVAVARQSDVPRRRRTVAALLAVALATAHLVSAPGNLSQSWAYGAFLLAVAAFEVLLAQGLLVRPSARLLLAGVIGNLAVVSVSVIARTAGLPGGRGGAGGHHSETALDAGHADYSGLLGSRPLDVGVYDVALLLGELGLLLLLVALLQTRGRRTAINLFLIVGGALWVLRWAGLLT